MNTKLNSKLVGLIKEHRWQELLRELPPNEPIPLTFDTIEEMNSLRTIAARLNSQGQDPNRYTFSGLNYITKAIVAIASPKCK